MMENRVWPVAVVFTTAFALMIFVLGTLVIVFRPSMVWGSEQKLLNMVQSSFPSCDDILTNGEEQRLDHTAKTNEHTFTLNSIHWPTDRSIVCIVHSTQSPSLTAFSKQYSGHSKTGSYAWITTSEVDNSLTEGEGPKTDVWCNSVLDPRCRSNL